MRTTDLNGKLSLASQLWHVLPVQACRGCHSADFTHVRPCCRYDNGAVPDSALILIPSAFPSVGLLLHPLVNRSEANVVHHDKLFACGAWPRVGGERRCADVQLPPDCSCGRLLWSSDDLSEWTVDLLPDRCPARIHSSHQEPSCGLHRQLSVHYARNDLHRHLLSACVRHQHPGWRAHCFIHQLESRSAYANPISRYFRSVTCSQGCDRDCWCRGYLYLHFYIYCVSWFRLHRYCIRCWYNSDLHQHDYCHPHQYHHQYKLRELLRFASAGLKLQQGCV
jgi:hypothetical protein